MPRLTVISPGEAFSGLWSELAERLGAELERCKEPSQATPAAAVILSCGGEEARALDLLRDTQRAGVDAPIVVGAATDHRLAVELMRRGAAAYFALPGDAGRLERDLEARLAAAGVDAERAPARERFDFGSIIGEDAGLRASLDRAARVIPNGRATVLIIGETGTGKELVARAIHDNGPRAEKPYVAVNCGAIPATLLESELFGHEKGAFTDARSSKPGLLEVADGGTVFLDEISAMPVELQAKLLRFLETREVRRLGGLRSTSVDVRVLAAANVDLRTLTERGEFREDLYFRLAVVPIPLPPLRDRGKDVEILARHFLAHLGAEYGVDPPVLSREAMIALEQHRWPGNVRELRNAIERALLLSDGSSIQPEHLALAETAPAERPGEVGSPIPFPSTLDELETAAAHAMVARFSGNKSAAARALGITRSRLYRILERGEGG